MPRHSVTVSKALGDKLSAFAEKQSISVSQAIAKILAQHFNQPAQDHSHGGKRKNAGRKANRNEEAGS